MEDDERQDMERFSMDSDFVDGEWIDGEFYYRSRRKRRGQTKEEALYGYDSSGSDSGGRRGRKKRRGGLIIDDKSSKPVNFVLGNVQNVGSENEPSSSKKEEEDTLARDDSDDAVEDRGGVGLGFQRGGIGFQARSEEQDGVQRGGIGFQARNEEEDGAGLGFQRGGIGFETKNEDGDSFRPRNDDTASRAGIGLGFQPKQNEHRGGGSGIGFQTNGRALNDDDADLELPSALGKKIQEKAREKTKNKPGASIAGDKFSWQKHSSGFVGKMLQKMGLNQNRGLGKNAQGIVNAIDVKVRPKNMGMGYNNYQESTTASTESSKAIDESIEKPKQSEQLWMKKNKKKVKSFVSAEELLSRQQGRTLGKVLDMTGPQIRVVTDMKDLNVDRVNRVNAEEDDTPMPELQHNLRLLVDLVGSDIQQYDSKLRHDKQTIAILEKDKIRLQRELDLQTKSLETMQSIASAVDRIQQEAAARRLTLEKLHASFGKIKSEFPDEFKLWNLSALALCHALPRVMTYFQNWQPLLQPSRGIDVLIPWMDLLADNEEAIFAEADTSAYTRLVVETVIPHVYRAVHCWEPRDAEPMLRFLEVWEKVLPPAAFQTVLDGSLVPKLRDAVDSWDPLRDTVPVHVWIHPWLPLLGSRMDPICETIRAKLSNALAGWDASDVTAYLMLAPWVRVFDSSSWGELLDRRIVPKLMAALDRLEINPAAQQLDAFNCVMAWAPVMPQRIMIAMLEEKFFPKWHRALYAWLGSDPDFAEVSQWYEGWKSLFPASLEGTESIRSQLQSALAMMEQAVEGETVVMPAAEHQRNIPAAPPAVKMSVAAEEEEMSLKGVVESFATENDVALVPKRRRFGAMDIYGFGSVSIVMDAHNQVVMALVGERWTSVSLEQLLGIHRSRQGGNWNP